MKQSQGGLKLARDGISRRSGLEYRPTSLESRTYRDMPSGIAILGGGIFAKEAVSRRSTLNVSMASARTPLMSFMRAMTIAAAPPRTEGRSRVHIEGMLVSLV